MGGPSSQTWPSGGRTTHGGSLKTGSGHNVNGWHWSETNVFEPAKALLTDLLADEQINPALWADGTRLCKLEKFSGDIHTNVRKGKINLTYDLVVHFKWEADEPEGELDNFSGLIKFAEVIDDEPEAVVNIKSGKDREGANERVRLMKTAGAEQGRKLIMTMLDLCKKRATEAMSPKTKGANSTNL